jgi:curved DNA-binding protein CbpA
MSTTCYQVLGLVRPISMAELKAAYRAAASLHHPDRGSSHEAMIQVNDAYEQVKWELERQSRNSYHQSPPPPPQDIDPLSVWIENIDNLIKQQSENGYKKGWVMFRLLQSDIQPPLKAWEYLAKRMEYKDGWARYKYKEWRSHPDR